MSEETKDPLVIWASRCTCIRKPCDTCRDIGCSSCVMCDPEPLYARQSEIDRFLGREPDV